MKMVTFVNRSGRDQISIQQVTEEIAPKLLELISLGARPVKKRIGWAATFLVLGFAALYVASFVLSGHGRELMNITAGFLFGLACAEAIL